jgi:hypothetical protein
MYFYGFVKLIVSHWSVYKKWRVNRKKFMLNFAVEFRVENELNPTRQTKLLMNFKEPNVEPNQFLLSQTQTSSTRLISDPSRNHSIKLLCKNVD